MNENNARIWTTLQKSNSDLETAIALMKTDVPGKNDQIGFHLQQSAEKSLKAIIMINGIEYNVAKKAGHDLRALLELIDDTRPYLPGDIDQVLELQGFAVEGRYDDIDDSNSLDVAFMVNLVEDLYKTAIRYYKEMSKQ